MALLLGALLLPPTRAQADGASGTYTGDVELRGNYYWERSTRVIAPAVRAKVETPGGTILRGDYLVDTITSASPAAGTLVDIRFTEVRHQFSLGAAHEFELPDQRYLLLSGGTTLSLEPDYRSYGGNLQAALILNQRATTFRLGLAYNHDAIEQLYRDGSGILPRQVGTFNESLDGLALSVAWEQVVLPFLTASIGYDYGWLRGFLANPYRTIGIQGVLVSERHPASRHRHTLHGHLAAYVPPTRSAVHLLYRAYLDSWRIAALNPEVRLYQELGPVAQLRLRYRYYRQREAFFYTDPNDYVLNDPYVTADPKMAAFRSHLLGAQIRMNLAFFRHTALRFLGDGSLDLGLDLIWSNSAYGNAVLSQIGVRAPF